MPTEPVEAREAEWGSRMIEVKVRFWTDKIADGKGKILPKHAWNAGVVRMDRNEPHEIVPGAPIPFNSFADLPAKVEQLLIEHEIKLHLSRKQRKYIAP